MGADTGEPNPLWRGAALCLGTTAVSAVVGFYMAIKSSQNFDNDLMNDSSNPYSVKNIPQRLATRLTFKALGIASILSVSVVAGTVYGVWRFSRAANSQEFRSWSSSFLPRLKPASDPSTNFKTFNELLEYILSCDKVPNRKK